MTVFELALFEIKEAAESVKKFELTPFTVYRPSGIIVTVAS